MGSGMLAAPGIASQALADWEWSQTTVDFMLLPAYGDPNLYFAVPRSARLAQKAAQIPDFFLEFVSDRNDPKGRESLYAIVHIGLEPGGDYAATYRALAAGKPAAALSPLAFATGGYCHFECADAHERAPFAWEDGQRATIHSRISAASGQLIYGALGSGSTAIVKAAIECEVPAMLPRIASTT